MGHDSVTLGRELRAVQSAEADALAGAIGRTIGESATKADLGELFREINGLRMTMRATEGRLRVDTEHNIALNHEETKRAVAQATILTGKFDSATRRIETELHMIKMLVCGGFGIIAAAAVALLLL